MDGQGWEGEGEERPVDLARAFFSSGPAVQGDAIYQSRPATFSIDRLRGNGRRGMVCCGLVGGWCDTGKVDAWSFPSVGIGSDAKYEAD